MSTQRDSALKNIFRTLRYRNFRLFFLGQGISVVGTWMQQVAMGWLVYRLTSSAFALGVVAFASQIPTFVLSPLTGVAADRWNRHRLLLVTQTLSLVQALVLAALTLTGAVRVSHIIILGFLLGCINSLDIPVRQAFLVEMVERKENLSNAIALNSLMFNSARLIGPSVAGIIVAVFGEGICFVANALSFLAVLASLVLMDIQPRQAHRKHTHILKEIREGFAYAFGFAPIRYILLLLCVTSLVSMSYIVLMPVFARDILKGGAETLGFLVASAGVGALISTVYLASRRSVLGLGRLIPISASVFAAGIILFAMSRTLWISMALLAVAGFGMMANMASCNTILQTIADDDKRGRVMSFYMMAFMGVAPLGSLIAGALASSIGVMPTVAIGGALCVAAAAVFATKLPAIRALVHPIYRKIGIIPEVASGVNVAAELIVPPED